ncbi:thioesterase family protein [Klenkia sp. PcliD-1-E]|uniref:thioesterase family protein n=1 Tax=Klenkia sp. PcliD-1-E TaxID=2954492 RepID=UPI0020978C59|nr:thioesterase family protein [Klenkia sp. PcliD-1-E]MCO7222561.1 thioesterase family protein [Klenkia sp. PcliD-1-E]
MPRSFDDATALTAAEGGFTAHLDPGWDVGGGVLNGGYLLAVVARAALEVSPHTHPVALSASYLRAPAPGPATVSVTAGPAGRTLQHGSAVLGDAGGPAVPVQWTTATLHDVPAEHGVPAPAATPVEDCFSVAENAHLAPPGLTVPGISQQVETRLDPLTAGWALGQPSTEPVVRAWVRFADGREPDPLGLVAFTDVLPPTSWATGKLGWAPTVQLQTLIRALPAPGWCLVEARGNEVSDGWVDEDYRVWDSTGRFVAQSRQLARSPR